MPRIPIQYNQGRLGGSNVVAATADPGAFSHGAEMKYRLGDDLWKQFEAMQKTKDYIYTLQAITDAEGKARDLYTEEMLNAKPGAEGFTKSFNGRLDEQLNAALENAPSTQARTMLFEQMANMRRGYLNHAAQSEHASRMDHLENQAIETVNGRVNSLIRSGGDVGSVFGEIDSVVDSMAGALGSNKAASYRHKLKQQAAYGVLSGAITDDKAHLGSELMSGKYDQYLTPGQMSSLVRMSKAAGRQKAATPVQVPGLAEKNVGFEKSFIEFRKMFKND